jgi:hypothetical protein
VGTRSPAIMASSGTTGISHLRKTSTPETTASPRSCVQPSDRMLTVTRRRPGTVNRQEFDRLVITDVVQPSMWPYGAQN